MFAWRVTKYDPRLRDERGHYLRDDWTMAAEIGTECADGVLTLEEYLRVESRYVSAVERFWGACGSPPLQIQSLQFGGAEHKSLADVGFGDWRPVNGEYLPAERLEAVVRWCLRDLGWCQLVADRCFVHFGWDFYMYFGADTTAQDALQAIAADGLFVEEFESPYLHGAPTAFSVTAFRIGEDCADHEMELPDLSASAIADLWPDITALVGYPTRPIDADLAARIRRYADVTFDFERFTYQLESDV